MALCLIILSVLVWQTALLLDRGLTPQPQNRIPATLLAALFGATLLSATLPPIDWDIETSTALPKTAFRAAHAISYIVIAAAVLGVGLWSNPDTAGATVLLRDLLGLCGSVLLVAAFVDSRLAWTPAFVYTSVALLAGHSTSHIVTWMRNDGDDRLSWLIAAVLVAVGLIVFILRGPKRVS
ncbi:hypothetical protein [uncultured Jatrophihabitans sp.]|uniref:hypothetical protein n=1 Tax=uncultured Jatrophihabitans sp. TaxID=1610747 RepID=UPI0035CB776E